MVAKVTACRNFSLVETNRFRTYQQVGQNMLPNGRRTQELRIELPTQLLGNSLSHKPHHPNPIQRTSQVRHRLVHVVPLLQPEQADAEGLEVCAFVALERHAGCGLQALVEKFFAGLDVRRRRYPAGEAETTIGRLAFLTFGSPFFLACQRSYWPCMRSQISGPLPTHLPTRSSISAVRSERPLIKRDKVTRDTPSCSAAS